MTLAWWWIGVLLTVLPQTCIMYYVYWRPLKQRPVQCVWSKDGARKAYQRRCDTIQRLQMCFCMWRIFFYAPIQRVEVYSVCVYGSASVCRTWHAYRTAVWSLEYDKQNHRNTSTALLDIQMPFWAMADSAKHNLSYPKYFHFCGRCYWKVYSCGRSLDNPTHGIPFVTWKKTQAWFPRSGDNHLLNGFEAPLIFSTLWTGRIFVRRCPSWKHFRRWWGFMCWPGHHIVPRTHHIEPQAKDFLWDALPSGVGAISVENQDTWDAPSSDSKAGAIFGEEEDTLLKWVHLFASPMQLCAMS